MASRSKRLAFVLPFLILATSAYANGSMPLALQMFSYKTWVIYVVVMVVLEAWIVGVRSGMTWQRAILLAIASNLVSAFCCPELFAVGLHNDSINPNPFGFALYLFISFGIGSALIESIGWNLGKIQDDVRWTGWKVLGRSFAAHAIGVPIAMAILLIPSRPYEGIERTVGVWRGFALRSAIRRYMDDARVQGKLPNITSANELVEKYVQGYDRENPGYWAVAYIPSYSRFATGEEQHNPISWNPNAAGTPLDPDSKKPNPIWIMKLDEGVRGIEEWDVDLVTGDVTRRWRLAA